MAEQPSRSSFGELQIIRGIPFSKIFNENIIESVFDFEPRDGDVIIASYPKTGTTWMQYIVLQILTKAEGFPAFDDMLRKVMPFMEMTGIEAVENLTCNPRVYKHHMRYDMMKRNPKAKTIYTYRKPDDTLVSYYHFLKDLYGPLEFKEHYENFLSGNISYGRYFEHVLSYFEHKSDENVLLVSYESLKVRTKEEILRIARFLGQEYHDALVADEALLENILKNTSFEHMKENLNLINPHLDEKGEHTEQAPPKDEKKKVNFFRKGIIGDGKNSLTTEQLERIKELAKELMKENEIFASWYCD